MHQFVRTCGLLALIGLIGALAQPAFAQFQLKPAVAMEAEDFTVERGWKTVQNGQGNYMVDIIGFQHISGERLLCIDEKDATASAYMDITIPVDGDYRLWARYEYPPFTDDQFKVSVVQGNATVAEKVMGAKDNPRQAFGDTTFKAQYDPSWGAEGLVEEVVDVKGLRAGPARVYLKAVAQPQVAGVAAHRNIDFVYLTSDTADAWRQAYIPEANLYPILGAFRDSRGPRYEVQFTNKGAKAANLNVSHSYNRIPWGMNEGTIAANVAPGASTGWLPLKKQDTAHFSMVTFASSTGEDFSLAIRPAYDKPGAGRTATSFAADAGTVNVYIPSYPYRGETPVTPVQEITNVLKVLAETPAPGKKPTLPLCYGGWIAFDRDGEYGRKYAELYTALGMRNFSASASASLSPKAMENLKAAGWEPTKSLSIMGYRNPPLDGQIAMGKDAIQKSGLQQYLQFYDYGDEIHFNEWLGVESGELAKRPEFAGMNAQQIYAKLFQQWLAQHRAGFKPADYGAATVEAIKPDSSQKASVANPRLYVDSCEFYEDTAIAFVAEGNRKVKAALGQDVLCGANYAAHPFYYPTIPMYVKWFRGGAADYGRHSEYFWQVTQAGPMVNGYITEHFRTGMRFNPKAINRQYTMPHSPGNTTASFLRSAYSHIAHGAKMLDFFGIGMNECFTENHIDHRDAQRFREIRDITYSLGLVEDQMLQSKVVPSQVALLLSDSTERWDLSGIATDQAGYNWFGADFRKTRLSYHIERLGLWKALTFLNASPDLIVEEDLNPGILDGYDVLVVVGDCLPPAAVPAVEQWVRNGGVLLATAGAGRFDAYRQPTAAWQKLFGLANRTTEEKAAFFRPRQELPFLQPLAKVSAFGQTMPALAINERIQPAAGATVLATFDDGAPAAITSKLGNGRVFYCAALPGAAYLYTALQPPNVPDRGVVTHTVPTNFDPAVTAALKQVLAASRFFTPVTTDGGLIDTRLIKGPSAYILPLSNYNGEIGKPVTITLQVAEKIGKVTSAYAGELKPTMNGKMLTVTVPKLGYGDILRFDIVK